MANHDEVTDDYDMDERANVLVTEVFDTELIGGGGIYSWSEINNYKKLGADHFSVSTIFLKPFWINL